MFYFILSCFFEKIINVAIQQDFLFYFVFLSLHLFVFKTNWFHIV